MPWQPTTSGAVELLKNLAFAVDAVVVVRIDGDLGHILLVVLADQHGGRGRTGAELSDDFIAARQNVAGFGMGWIADELVARRRQLVFDLVEELDELVDRVEAVADVRVGAVLDQLVERLRRSVQNRADAKAPVGPELLRQVPAGFRPAPGR